MAYEEKYSCKRRNYIRTRWNFHERKQSLYEVLISRNFPCGFPFVYESSVMVDFKLKMKSLDDASVCPNSQNDDQCATSSPHSNCPDDRSNFRKLVRRKSDTLKEIIIVPLETNVNAVIPLPRIIEVQEQKKLPQFTRKKEFRRNIDNNIAVPSSSNDNGNVAERNNQAIPSKSVQNRNDRLERTQNEGNKNSSSISQNQNDEVTEKDETALRNICKIIIFTIATVGLSVFSVVPWTTIPRTNSIIYQSSWMEIILPMLGNCTLYAGADLLNLTIWTKERSLISIKILLKMSLANFAPFAISYILSSTIWCVYLGNNHPLPYLGWVLATGRFTCPFALWFVLPSSLTANEDYRKKLWMYIVYCLWLFVPVGQISVISYLFTNLPEAFQFLVVFMVAACREFDKRMRTHLVTKMMGTLDEPATVLVAINTSVFYSFYVATKLAGATGTTVFCVVSIDFALHSHITFQLIKQYNKVQENDTEDSTKKKNFKATKLILAELVEGFTPIVYGICMSMAYFGPNAELFVNIGSTFWGKPIKNINYVFVIMFLLYSVDTISATINSIVLWKFTKINMLKEFCGVLTKYWLFMVIKLSHLISSYFASNDVNFGIDFSGKFEWLTPEGRLNLIQNATISS